MAVLMVVACEITGLDPLREPAYLGDTGISIDIAVPDTVLAGAPFQFTIPVYGSGSCTVVDGVEVEYTTAGASLRPFVQRKGGVCTDDLRRFNATATLALNHPGTAELRIQARYGTLDDLSRHTVRDTTVVRHTFVR